MRINEAIVVLTEMQKWRRGEPPYDGVTPKTHRDPPYTPKVYGEALDVAIERMTNEVNNSTNNQNLKV